MFKVLMRLRATVMVRYVFARKSEILRSLLLCFRKNDINIEKKLFKQRDNYNVMLFFFFLLSDTEKSLSKEQEKKLLR